MQTVVAVKIGSTRSSNRFSQMTGQVRVPDLRQSALFARAANDRFDGPRAAKVSPRERQQRAVSNVGFAGVTKTDAAPLQVGSEPFLTDAAGCASGGNADLADV